MNVLRECYTRYLRVDAYVHDRLSEYLIDFFMVFRNPTSDFSDDASYDTSDKV
jgi:hypothetical protein